MKNDKIEVIKGDITKLSADAIVNAANTSLMGGGGVDGAIHRAGGPAILEACRKIVARQGGCKTGRAVITTAGNLPAKFVIHTVGPVWRDGTNFEAQELASCYINSLILAEENECRTVAFPCISTGAYGFPADKAAAIAVRTIRNVLKTKASIEHVTIVCFDDQNYRAVESALSSVAD